MLTIKRTHVTYTINQQQPKKHSYLSVDWKLPCSSSLCYCSLCRSVCLSVCLSGLLDRCIESQHNDRAEYKDDTRMHMPQAYTTHDTHAKQQMKSDNNQKRIIFRLSVRLSERLNRLLFGLCSCAVFCLSVWITLELFFPLSLSPSLSVSLPLSLSVFLFLLSILFIHRRQFYRAKCTFFLCIKSAFLFLDNWINWVRLDINFFLNSTAEWIWNWSNNKTPLKHMGFALSSAQFRVLCKSWIISLLSVYLY